MRFFIPDAKDEVEAESLYQAIRGFVAREMHEEPTDRRIYSITHVHDGVRHVATVGERFDLLMNETVVAIMEGRRAWYVFTLEGGIAHRLPYIVGPAKVCHIEDFEKHPS